MTDLTQMTVTELKHYLSENRSDDDKFSEALAELLKRDQNPVIYSKDIPLEEQDPAFLTSFAITISESETELGFDPDLTQE